MGSPNVDANELSRQDIACAVEAPHVRVARCGQRSVRALLPIQNRRDPEHTRHLLHDAFSTASILRGTNDLELVWKNFGANEPSRQDIDT